MKSVMLLLFFLFLFSCNGEALQALGSGMQGQTYTPCYKCYNCRGSGIVIENEYGKQIAKKCPYCRGSGCN
jgi:hypothetical protein